MFACCFPGMNMTVSGRCPPVSIPSFVQYIGMPLTAVPDPLGEFSSYARRFESEFETAMAEIGIELDYRYQTAKLYVGNVLAGNRDSALQKAARNRRHPAVVQN